MIAYRNSTQDTDTGIDVRPSTCVIMAMTNGEIKQIYEIQKRLKVGKDYQALRAGCMLFGFSKRSRKIALEEIDIFIKELKKYRPEVIR